MRRLRLREALERASDPNTGAEELAKLAYHGNPSVRLAVAQHANISAATRRLLASDFIPAVKHALEPPGVPEQVTTPRCPPPAPPNQVVVVGLPWWSIATAVAAGMIAGGIVLYFMWERLMLLRLESVLSVIIESGSTGY